MNSMMTSTPACRRPGTPVVAFLATNQKRAQKNMPKPIDQNIESTWMALKPIALASTALCANVQVDSVSTSVP